MLFSKLGLAKSLGTLALGTMSVLASASDASAGIFCRNSCTTVYCAPVYYTPVIIPHVPVAPPVHHENAVRQVRVTYFNTKYSAWFETDAMVSHDNAAIGLSVYVNVPGVGQVRGWVVTVYTQPRMQSPYGTATQEAVKAPAHVSLNADETAVKSLVSTKVESDRLSGCTRLWTNKAGDKHVVAELVKVNANSVTVRNTEGKLVEQPFDNLSEADVKFVRTASVATPMAEQVN